MAKCDATRSFVADAVEQGEKVIVFSCFDEPIRALARHLGVAAVTLTGSTPVERGRRSSTVSSRTSDVRVFLANIIAGGTGLNLTAARQVVFNDLDWVPANHWQAEDRAYRIGQTATVNVTYMVGSNTFDEFVCTVLSTKAALVEAVVEGKAVSDAAYTGVLEELERALGGLSPGFADVSAADLDDEQVGQLLRELASTAAHGSRAMRQSHWGESPRPFSRQKGVARAGACAEGPRGHEVPRGQRVEPWCALHARRQRRAGRRVLLPGIRVPRSMPARARPEAGARQRRWARRRDTSRGFE